MKRYFIFLLMVWSFLALCFAGGVDKDELAVIKQVGKRFGVTLGEKPGNEIYRWKKGIGYISREGHIVVLNLSSLQITDLSFVKKLPHLEKLYLMGTQVEDIGPLSILENLTQLNLNSAKVKNFDALRYLDKLTTLSLGETFITTLPPWIVDWNPNLDLYEVFCNCNLENPRLKVLREGRGALREYFKNKKAVKEKPLTEKDRYEKTLAKLEKIDSALKDYLNSMSEAPDAKDIHELENKISPFYIKHLPIKDAWDMDIIYKKTGKETWYVASGGSDKKFAGLKKGSYTSYEGQDIIVSRGELISGPKPGK